MVVSGLLVLSLNAAYSIYILGVASGRPWLVVSPEDTLAKVIPLCACLYFTMAVVGASELCANGTDGVILVVKSNDSAILEASSSTPAALFAMLFVQGAVQVVSQQQKRHLFVAPMLIVHLLAACFYGLSARSSHCTLAARWSMGSGVIPLHYGLWMCSISAQVLTLFHMERGLVGGNGKSTDAVGKSTTDASTVAPTPAHRSCCIALLAIQGMLLFGAVGDAWHGSLIINLLAHSCCFACFYALLLFGIARPIAVCIERAQGSARADKANEVLRFRRVCTYLIITYHAFPLVWACDNLGWLPDAEVRIGYMMADIMAKLLPPSIYITVAMSQNPEQ